MIDDFAALVPFARAPDLKPEFLADNVSALEPGVPATVSSEGDILSIECGGARAQVSAHKGQMPEDTAIASIGMADFPDEERTQLMKHGAYVLVRCDNQAGDPMARMILLLKCGMALCAANGWALCIPCSGLCFPAGELQKIVTLNQQGPRVWGLDDAEGSLPAYEPRLLWDSLRKEAQPAKMLVGFVPAQVENQAWFFSAGHSLFGLPEIVFSDGSLEDYATVRELFRFIFPYFCMNPSEMKAGKVVRTSDSELTISLHALPERHAELQASTGTLRIRLSAASEVDSEWDT